MDRSDEQFLESYDLCISPKHVESSVSFLIHLIEDSEKKVKELENCLSEKGVKISYKRCTICYNEVLCEWSSPTTYIPKGFHCGIPHQGGLIKPECKQIICMDCFLKQHFYCSEHKKDTDE